MPSEVTGVVVTEVVRGSPAARLGFAPRDIVVAVNGEQIASVDDLQTLAESDPLGVSRSSVVVSASGRSSDERSLRAADVEGNGRAPSARRSPAAEKLGEVTGQEHLTGEDGVLAR